MFNIYHYCPWGDFPSLFTFQLGGERRFLLSEKRNLESKLFIVNLKSSSLLRPCAFFKLHTKMQFLKEKRRQNRLAGDSNSALPPSRGEVGMAAWVLVAS
jgi:hypothetical protein